MQNLNINEAKAGDKLARDLRMEDGSTLLAKGAELNDSIIIRLQRMGVCEIVVEGNAEAATDNSQEALASLEQRFRAHADNELMMELKEAIRTLIAPGA